MAYILAIQHLRHRQLCPVENDLRALQVAMEAKETYQEKTESLQQSEALKTKKDWSIFRQIRKKLQKNLKLCILIILMM